MCVLSQKYYEFLPEVNLPFINNVHMTLTHTVKENAYEKYTILY